MHQQPSASTVQIKSPEMAPTTWMGICEGGSFSCSFSGGFSSMLPTAAISMGHYQWRCTKLCNHESCSNFMKCPVLKPLQLYHYIISYLYIYILGNPSECPNAISQRLPQGRIVLYQGINRFDPWSYCKWEINWQTGIPEIFWDSLEPIFLAHLPCLVVHCECLWQMCPENVSFRELKECAKRKARDKRLWISVVQCQICRITPNARLFPLKRLTSLAARPQRQPGYYSYNVSPRIDHWSLVMNTKCWIIHLRSSKLGC